MATPGGHLLVPKALRVFRFALEKTRWALRDKLEQATRWSVDAEAQPVFLRRTGRHHVSTGRIAAIRQSHSRWYFTQQAAKLSLRQFTSSALLTPKYGRSALPTSRTGQAISRLTSRAPFASSLRPNLTGGTLCRSAGGYSTGTGRIGGARYFSHTPASPADVVVNVSQAVRAFWISGQKAQFDGMSPRNEKRFKTISALQDKTGHKLRPVPAAAPGSYVDFKVTPTITAISPFSGLSGAASTHEHETLNDSTVMEMLSVDFARAAKDLALIMNDLQKLSSIGDLPLCLPNSSTLRVRLPGCDADAVNRLCQELEIHRGLVYQDDEFDSSNGTEMALLYPFAPGHTPSRVTIPPKNWTGQDGNHDLVDWQNMLSPQRYASKTCSIRSATSHDFEEVEAAGENPWLSSPSDYSSSNRSDEDDEAAYFKQAPQEHTFDSSGYEGLEGIYRFLEECDRARR